MLKCFFLVIVLVMCCMNTRSVSGQGIPKKASSGSNCEYWQAKVDATVGPFSDPGNKDEKDDQAVLEGISCLLKMKGNKHPAKFSGAVNYSVSQIFPPATADVAALYYISYLYLQKWDHASAIALRDQNGKINTPEVIETAYRSYVSWYKRIRAVGLVKARAAKLMPLSDSKVKWY